MTRLMIRIRPLTSPIHHAFRLDRGARVTGDLRGPRRASPHPSLDALAMLPGSDERLITTSELDQLRRTLPNRVA